MRIEHRLWNIDLNDGDALGEFTGSGFPIALSPEDVKGMEPGDIIENEGGDDEIRLVCFMTKDCTCDNCADSR